MNARQLLDAATRPLRMFIEYRVLRYPALLLLAACMIMWIMQAMNAIERTQKVSINFSLGGKTYTLAGTIDH